MKPLKLVALAVGAILVSLTLTGCAPAATSTGKLQIVASTNVWGDIAKQVGGDLVEVTSIIDSPNKDPHSYEATARDQLAVKKADLVIANGGGYDDFIETLSAAAGNKPIFRVNSSVTVVSWQENEHLWYSLGAVGEVAMSLAATLGALDETNSVKYAENADAYADELNNLAAKYNDVYSANKGASYFGTEPLAVWLLKDLGMRNLTPNEFSEAIENETDVPPATMKASLDLIKSGKVNFLVINAQTENSQVQQIIDAARMAAVKAVVLSEILPADKNYIQWMTANLNSLNPGK